MSKQILPKELSEIVSTLITNPESIGELGEANLYENFLEDVATIVTNYCGGIVNCVHAPDCPDCDDESGEYMISISPDDRLPSMESNVWSPYDSEGWEEQV